VVKGLSNFITDFIEVDPSTRTLQIGLTVPEMDITGLYRINGEVFILPLEGGGSFNSKMSTVKATGFSTILPVVTQDGKQVIQVENFNVDFNIGHVFIQMNNLFNGENKLLADTVNKFLNDHSQEVIKEVKPAISAQLSQLVTRVMNDAFSELPADKLLDNLQINRLPVQTEALPQTHPQDPIPAQVPRTTPNGPIPVQVPRGPVPLVQHPVQHNIPIHHQPVQKNILSPQQRIGLNTKARLLQLFSGRK